MRMRTMTVAVTAALAAALAGCGNGPPSIAGGSGGAVLGKAASSGLGTPAKSISATGSNSFDPGTVTVKAGQVIQWTNTGGVPHNVTFDEFDALTSTTLKQGDSWQIQFTVPGTYPYHCTFHDPTMTGTITVTS